MSYHPGSGSESRECPISDSTTAWPPSLHQHYPASLVLCSLRTSHLHLLALPLRLVLAYSQFPGQRPLFPQETWDLTGCLDDVLVSANGPSTPGLPSTLAVTRRGILPSSVNRPWAESDRKQSFRSSIPFRAGQPVPTFHPHCLSVYASTQDFDPQVLYLRCKTRYWASG